MRANVANDIADLVSRKPNIHSYCEIVEPDFGLPVAGSHMHVSRFIAFV